MVSATRLGAALAILALCTWRPALGQGLECPPNSAFGQIVHDPNTGWNAGLSDDAVGDLRYDNLFASTRPAVCGVHWWGWYSGATGGNCSETNPAFQITFYNDSDGQPGSATCSYQVLATVTPTGVFYGGSELLYFSVAALDPCCDTPGRWVSIAGVGDDSCWFRWMSAAVGAGDGLSYHFTDGVLLSRDFDLSLCLTTTPPVGACCQPDGACGVTTETDCTGAWQGADTSCTPNICPPPMGACCQPDGSCAVTVQAECGGNWLGAETSCDPNNPCPKPSGACCQAGDVCDMLTAAECDEADGQWYGPGITCAQAACPPPCTNWELRATDGPSPRGGHALAYDSARQVVVLFGGDYFSGETWEWDGSAWAQKSPAMSPGPLYQHALTYDAARGVVLLFGGLLPSRGIVSTTWTWDGTDWTPLEPPLSPPARTGHTLVYDAAREVVLLFGGAGGQANYLDDTWEWNGSTWTPRDVSGPAPRYGAAAAYDAARGVTVLFGGALGDLRSTAGDTWEWNGAAWSPRASTGPAPRFWHAMTYDAQLNQTLLFGGFAGDEMIDADTWLWDGDTWRRQFVGAAPTPRAFSALAYDTNRGEAVLFGGFSSTIVGDTWAFKPLPPPEIDEQPAPVTACIGDSVQFEITLPRIAMLSYQWRHNAVPLADNSRINGATTPTLSITPAVPSDAGSYDVIVSSECGSSTSLPATLTMRPTTSITAEPEPATVIAGQVAQFAVVAAGSGLEFEWRKDGQPLADDGRISGAATSTLTINAALLADAGSYAVLVSGDCGTELSASATLTVRPDRDGDGVTDGADNCPDNANSNQLDTDDDGVGDACDACPDDPNKTAPGACDCGTPDTDTDGDGTPDCHDGCLNDPNKTAPGVCDCGTPDTDTDGDGTPDCLDACPNDPNKAAPGACDCGTPDTDTDGDGVPDCVDNCPTVANPDQADTDDDGDGDACDDDQSGRVPPVLADSGFIRGLIDLTGGNNDDTQTDEDYFLDVLGRAADALGGADNDPNAGDANQDGTATDQTGRSTVGTALCPATSALLLGSLFFGVCRRRPRM